MIYNDRDDYLLMFTEDYSISDFSSHSMGSSLEKYLFIKLSDFILSEKVEEIVVVGNYDRSTGVSEKEKRDKSFNYKRPTFVFDGTRAYIKCYPGIDYVYHYASLVASYLEIYQLSKKLTVSFPNKREMKLQIEKSNLSEVPIYETIVMGYVEGLEYLSSDNHWNGIGDFLWKKINEQKILLGCKHSYWGEIAGDIVDFLSKRGVRRVIYVGKLGTLNSKYIPNETIATGSKSVFMDGSSVTWRNIFEKQKNDMIKNGIHYTLPSIIQETKEWVKVNRNVADFVDPEIGHMAKAALKNGIEFSYLHIVADSLVKKYEEDLSNERKLEIIEKRKVLVRTIGDCINKI